jgi:hypothetical protein
MKSSWTANGCRISASMKMRVTSYRSARCKAGLSNKCNAVGQMRREGMAIDRPKIDGLGRAAGRTAHLQEPMPCLERAADRRQEQHRHALGLPFIPRCDEAAAASGAAGVTVAAESRRIASLVKGTMRIVRTTSKL